VSTDIQPGSRHRLVAAGDRAWENGRDVLATMEPAFRDNLGDPARVDELLGRYWQRSLLRDPATTRRIDHIRCDAGYVDLSDAYHHSVEECLVLAGAVTLSAEGTFVAGDYFWRPPGWVHGARSPEGFEALLMMEGEAPDEGSGRVTRVVRPASEAGTNPLHGEDGAAAVGPRGYVRRVETRYLPWRALGADVLALDGLAHKPLSENVVTGARSLLARAPAGWDAVCGASACERLLVVVDGELVAGDAVLARGSLVELPRAGGLPLRSAAGCELLVKAAGRTT